MSKVSASAKSTATATASSGIGFGGLLTIAFIVLKLCGVIDWSWFWVLSPLWISAALIIGILVFAVIIIVILSSLK